MFVENVLIQLERHCGLCARKSGVNGSLGRGLTLGATSSRPGTPTDQSMLSVSFLSASPGELGMAMEAVLCPLATPCLALSTHPDARATVGSHRAPHLQSPGALSPLARHTTSCPGRFSTGNNLEPPSMASTRTEDAGMPNMSHTTGQCEKFNYGLGPTSPPRIPLECAHNQTFRLTPPDRTGQHHRHHLPTMSTRNRHLR